MLFLVEAMPSLSKQWGREELMYMESVCNYRHSKSRHHREEGEGKHTECVKDENGFVGFAC